ncbi:molecular chaperone SurA [Alcanivorax sp. HI0083]|uniref:peptidylprolyl isomerase n=1 Tax=unclassified Alcanivorax TaxID=2638842 RepID=UPI0007B83482|nr:MULTISPECIES: peptidylprolyl isomerase [unclassified Alcanivorax]KZY34466.1 molecular chaperone SurA [Alcanivorax sp. HI0044]KZZ23835.1 molecular chaperone SurA [Alcanivorax sp. HI0083]
MIDRTQHAARRTLHARHTLLGLLAMAVLMLPAWSQAKVQMLDRIVAVVNDGAIMASELDERINTIALQFQEKGQQLPPPAVMREQVLDRMVLERLQLQLAERAGIKVDDASLNQALAGIARQNGMSLEDFATALREDGYDWPQFREQIREDMVISRLQQRSVASRIQVTDREVDRFLSSEMGKQMFQEDFHLGHILVRVPAEASPEDITQARSKAESIVKKLNDGGNFQQLAVAESDGPKALEGGDLGMRPAAQWPTLFAENAIDLNKGEISEPLRSGAGFHILKMIDRKGGAEKVVTQYQVRHVLIKTDALTSAEQAHKQAIRLHDEIAAGSRQFSETAAEFSDDPGSARNGGELGWVNKGEMVPEFEDMMLNTPVGELSPVFESQFGWHFLRVDDVRDADMSAEFRRMQATQALQKRRFEEELETWVQEKRSESYVDIRL